MWGCISVVIFVVGGVVVCRFFALLFFLKREKKKGYEVGYMRNLGGVGGGLNMIKYMVCTSHTKT